MDKEQHRGSTQNQYDELTSNLHGTTIHGGGSRVQTKIFQRHISREEAASKTHKQSAVVTFTFLLFTSPLYISYLLFAFVQYEPGSEIHAMLILIYHVAHKMYITNSAINFVLYLFAGSRFRKDFVSLILHEKHVYQTSSSQSNSVSQQSTRVSLNIVRK